VIFVQYHTVGTHHISVVMLGVLFAQCLDIFVVIFCKKSCGLWTCLIVDSAVHSCRFWWKLFSERRVEPGVFERVLELA